MILIKIGTIELGKHPLLLAPMENISDPSFRYVCKRLGADLMYSEFISSDGLIRNGEKSLKKLQIFDYERPIGIQLCGHLIESMVEAVKIVEQLNPEIIDINFGCSVKKIVAKGAGAGMLNDIPKMVKMTSAIVNETNIPVTVKTRLGVDENNKNIIEVAERLQDTGIKAITIHGRTLTQRFKGAADWTLIGKVKNNPRMRIPVFGNGDINGPDIAKLMFDKYVVDGIMIGRASIGNPWIFKEIKHYLEKGEKLPLPTIKEKVKLVKSHLRKSIELKGKPCGIYEMRRHFSNYFKGLPNFRKTKLKLLTSQNFEEIIKILDGIAIQYADVNSCGC